LLKKPFLFDVIPTIIVIIIIIINNKKQKRKKNLGQRQDHPKKNKTKLLL